MDFVSTLNMRVRDYFKESGKSKFANNTMVFKSIFMVALYLIPYGFLVSGLITSAPMLYLMWAVMGFGMAGIGLSIMHDANHGAYSKNQTVNKWMGNLIVLVGGSPYNWRIQHNVLHHTFTNIDGLDEDLDSGPILRFSPHQELRSHHKYQYIYAWALYSLLTLMWSTTKDWRQIFRYNEKDLIKTQKMTFKRMLLEQLSFKVFYTIVFFVVPFLVVPLPWYAILGGILMMHAIAGVTLAAIFQPAHVVPETDFPLPDDEGNMENNWAIHQLLTTTNFAPNSKLFSWYVGGLNFQIEHHLFPNVCHVHYKTISKIVKKTASEFNLPYYSKPTFFEAISSHTKMLYQLGRA